MNKNPFLDMLNGFGGSPFQRALTDNSNTLFQAGLGLLSGRNWREGFQNAAQGVNAGSAADMAYKQQMQAEEERKRLLAQQTTDQNMTLEWLQNNYPEYAGLPAAQGFQLALKDMGQGTGTQTSEIQNYEYGLTHPDFAATAGGVYDGTSMDAQNWNIVLRGDVNSPEYAAAYSQLMQPKMTLQQTESGLVPIWSSPQLPPSIKPPGYSVPPPAAAPSAVPAPMSSGMPAVAAPQTAGGPSVGSPIPGTQKPPTEAQARIGEISRILINEVPTVAANFPALTDPKGQLLGIGGDFTNVWQSEEYQRAANAVRSTVANVLYALSGATANPGEVQNQIAILTPKFGDKPGVIADKLERFYTYIQSVASASGDPQLIATVNQVVRRAKAGPAGPPLPKSMKPAVPGKRKTTTGVEWSM